MRSSWRAAKTLATQKTTSTTACGVINTLPDAQCSYELLNPGEAASADDAALLAQLDESPERLESVLKSAFERSVTANAAGRAPCVWGFKIFPIPQAGPVSPLR